jgi:hypothetical protein
VSLRVIQKPQAWGGPGLRWAVTPETSSMSKVTHVWGCKHIAILCHCLGLTEQRCQLLKLIQFQCQDEWIWSTGEIATGEKAVLADKLVPMSLCAPQTQFRLASVWREEAQEVTGRRLYRRLQAGGYTGGYRPAAIPFSMERCLHWPVVILSELSVNVATWVNRFSYRIFLSDKISQKMVRCCNTMQAWLPCCVSLHFIPDAGRRLKTSYVHCVVIYNSLQNEYESIGTTNHHHHHHLALQPFVTLGLLCYSPPLVSILSFPSPSFNPHLS